MNEISEVLRCKNIIGYIHFHRLDGSLPSRAVDLLNLFVVVYYYGGEQHQMMEYKMY